MLCLKVGNKNDDPERKVVETEDAYKFAGQMGIQLFETSAKENVNVEEVSSGRAGQRAGEDRPTGSTSGFSPLLLRRPSDQQSLSAHCWLAAGQPFKGLSS